MKSARFLARLLIGLWLFSLIPITQAQSVTGRQRSRSARTTPRVTYVSICQSRGAYAYHSGMCRGLARCTHSIGRMSVAQARSAGYSPCKICY